MDRWRVFWVGSDWGDELSGAPYFDGAGVGRRVGDPVFVAPDYRIDSGLCRYGQSVTFRRYTGGTKRNYATDITLLLTFLWSRGCHWTDTRSKDLDDFEDWRLRAQQNPQRVGGSKWNRELSAFSSLFRWARKQRYISENPVAMREVSDPNGVIRKVPAGLTKVASARMHWLTPRSWRLWTDIGLRGHTANGLLEPGWFGRLEDRNTAFTRLLVSSGLRLQEGGSLLTFEVPTTWLRSSRYCRGQVSSAVTRAKATRTFYASTEAVRDVEAYVDSSRARAVRKAQMRGRYERLPVKWLVTKVTKGPKRQVHWVDQAGVGFNRDLDQLTWQERSLLLTEGSEGPEPLWLWLNEAGLPFQPHSWEAVFRGANARCRVALEPPEHLRSDPHKVYSPYATPHSARHSMALYMLVVLNAVMDQRYGLTPAERRDFRMLYGDPWQLVQGLLGHATRKVTVDTYLAPVRHLQLESLLVEVESPLAAPLPDLDQLFTRVARDAEGIQDVDGRMTVNAS